MKTVKLLFVIIFALHFSTTSFGQWGLTGNTGILTTNFLGTTDSKDLVLKTNNTERIRIGATGAIGISAPGSFLLNTSSTLLGMRALTNENLYLLSGSIMGAPGTGIYLNAANDLNSSLIPFTVSSSIAFFNASDIFSVNLNPAGTGFFNVKPYTNTNLMVTGNASAINIAASNDVLTQNREMNFIASKYSFNGTGTVNIGSNPTCTFPVDAKLLVNGKIYATSIQVKLSGVNGCFPDYVFEKGYKLRSLPEVEKYIQAYKHLPEVPTAAEVEEKGMDLAEMNAVLLKKIEELTLHMIEMKKEIEVLKNK